MLVRYRKRSEWLWQMAVMVNPKLGEPSCAAAFRGLFFDRLQQAGVMEPGAGERAFVRLDMGEVGFHQLYHAFMQAADVTSDQVPRERFAYAYSCSHQIIPETCAILREVQDRGVALIAATNGDSDAAGDLLALQAGIRWSGRIISSQLGCKKPELKFYCACLELAQHAMGDPKLQLLNCAYVDDIATYVQAYRKLDIKLPQAQAICFDATRQPAEELRTRLVELGLLPA